MSERDRLRVCLRVIAGAIVSDEDLKAIGVDRTLRCYPAQLQDAAINVAVEIMAK